MVQSELGKFTPLIKDITIKQGLSGNTFNLEEMV